MNARTDAPVDFANNGWFYLYDHHASSFHFSVSRFAEEYEPSMRTANGDGLLTYAPRDGEPPFGPLP